MDTTTTLLRIAGSGAAATSLLAAWWWNTNGFHNPMTVERRERQRLAHIIEPRALPWTDEELQMYDGTTNDDDNDDNGGYSILMAVKDRVFDVGAKNGHRFYGPDGEYRIMAGRDASRFLAKNILIEETHDERNVRLSAGEEANLEMWYWIIRNKYPLVGTYENNGHTTINQSSVVDARDDVRREPRMKRVLLQLLLLRLLRCCNVALRLGYCGYCGSLRLVVGRCMRCSCAIQNYLE
jgi:hypothetical protein